jgi:hypothetical protein
MVIQNYESVAGIGSASAAAFAPVGIPAGPPVGNLAGSALAASNGSPDRLSPADLPPPRPSVADAAALRARSQRPSVVDGSAGSTSRQAMHQVRRHASPNGDMHPLTETCIP